MTHVTPHATPSVTLNNGVQIPALGFGVYQVPPEETQRVVADALSVGYRSIDTAAGYANEQGVGAAIRESGLPRDDVFVTTKLWVQDKPAEDNTRGAFETSLGRLGLDRVDLYLIHQPYGDLYGQWRAMERLLEEGLVRAIGVANLYPDRLVDLIEHNDVVPAVNQVEVHPYFRQADVLAADAAHGIITQAWSPIGGITFYGGFGETGRSTLEDPTITGIAAAHGRTPAQVMLRWHLQQGRQVIPKSVTPSRIAANADVVGCVLTESELAALDALDTGVRGGPDPEEITSASFGGITVPEA